PVRVDGGQYLLDVLEGAVAGDVHGVVRRLRAALAGLPLLDLPCHQLPDLISLEGVDSGKDIGLRGGHGSTSFRPPCDSKTQSGRWVSQATGVNRAPHSGQRVSYQPSGLSLMPARPSPA